ncbi:MAG TPA: hypothetical protein ENI87_07205, partial [bacterium]|nr:hypothetical protein [bacterium]
MFDRFIRLARAKKALREQRYLDALQQASDRLIAEDRRAEQVRERALQALVERARARLQAGDVGTAAAEARRLRQLASGQLVEDLVREVDAAAVDRAERSQQRQSARAGFRRLVAAGDLAAAEDLLATLALADDERSSMRQHLVDRRQQAVALLDRAVADADEGRSREAADGVLQAIALDRGLPRIARSAALRKVAKALVKDVEAWLSSARAADLVEGLQRWSAGLSRLPELHDDRDVARLRDRLQSAAGDALRACDSLAEAGGLVRAVRAAELELAAADEAVAALVSAAEGDDVELAVWARLHDAAKAAGMAGLAALAADRVRSSTAGEQRLAAARELLEQGELEAARAMFVQFLAEHPLHEGVQRELELLDESMADLDRRLADLRLTLRAG